MAALPPLATAADLALVLGRTFTPTEELRAQALLDQASSTVRGYLRLQVSAGSSTLRVPAGGAVRQWLDSPFDCRPHGEVWLPERPVISVSEVRVNGVAVGGWWLDGQRLLVGSLPPAAPGGNGPPLVEVDYEHGWDPVPGDIAAIVMQAANRALVNPGQVRSEAVGGESTTYLIPTSGEALGVLLSRTEMRALDRYRLRSGTVRVRPA